MTRTPSTTPPAWVFLGVNLATALVLFKSSTFAGLHTLLGFSANRGMARIVVAAADIVFSTYLLKLSPKKRGSAGGCSTRSTRSISAR